MNLQIIGQFNILALLDLADAPVKALAKGLLNARGNDLGRFDNGLLGQCFSLSLQLTQGVILNDLAQ